MRIGLIGTGRIGTFHAEVLSRHPAVDTLLLADADPERAAAAAARTGATAVAVDDLFTGDGEAAQSWGEQFLVITKLGCCGARDVYTGYSLLNGQRLFSATGNRLPGDWARLEVPNSGGLLRWAFMHAAYSADADSIFAGYAGWDAGQLERELEFEMWHVVPALTEDVFDSSPEDLWRRVLRRQGGELALLSTWTSSAELN